MDGSTNSIASDMIKSASKLTKALLCPTIVFIPCSKRFPKTWAVEDTDDLPLYLVASALSLKNSS